MTLILLSGCIDDTLDRKPLNMVSDADIWVSQTMIDIYLVNLYNNIPLGSAVPFLADLTDEATYRSNPAISNTGSNALALNTGMYTWIRKANYFLQSIETATISETMIKQYAAECRFIRAYYYFDLVKKYGGMPIIKEVQVFDNNLDSLQVPRNTEDEVYDFILKELDAAIVDLPVSWDANNANRATKTVAQALKSRAMLYAGSIAKYGTVQLNGLIGIPASKATAYFTESMNASDSVMKSTKYSLYDISYNPETKVGDPSKNYQNIFLDENNKEVIFQKAFSLPDKPNQWDWDFNNSPAAGAAIAPLLDLVESYENIDGTPGILNVEGKEFDSPDSLFKNKDPRFDASIFRSGSWFIDRKLQIWAGIYDVVDNNKLYGTVNVPFPKDIKTLQVGRDGPYPLGGTTKSGFYIKKYINTTTLINSQFISDQNYIDIRYAEILLNYAEAAVEMGTNLDQGLVAMNLVRARAGIKKLILSELTIPRVRNERKVELAFEDKRFWDIRRWRIGTTLFNNTFMRGLYPYLKYDGTSYKYIFKVWSNSAPLDDGKPRVWEEKDYYSNLSGYISTNNNIRNNPGW